MITLKPDNPYSAQQTQQIAKPNNTVLSNQGTCITAIAKFQQNIKAKASTMLDNDVISRTYGKVAVIDRNWIQAMKGHIDMPQQNELWLVDIVRDTAPATNKGCLVLHPRHKIDHTEVSRLVMGMYSEDFLEGILYVRPKHVGPYWIMPLALRSSLDQKYPNTHSIIVTL